MSGQAEGKGGFAPGEIADRIRRVERLLERTDDPEKVRVGLGMRLALAMAEEMRAGKTLGAETGDLVAAWSRRYDAATVDAAIAVARQFLLKPGEMKELMATRLGLEG